jgi:hypothetical protein
MAGEPSRKRFAGGIVRWLTPFLPAVALYYALLLLIGAGIVTGKPGLFAPVDNGLAFNSMLAHLLRGEFDVDPAAIGYEGFVRNGRTYAYFGPFVAALRLPLSLIGDLGTTDFTVLSCLLATVILAGFTLASVLVVWQSLPPSALRMLIGGALIVTALFAGPQIAFLKPSIYQEVVLWANALAAAFVYLALRGLFLRGAFSTGLLTAMALLAGICLNTRVSTAIGLYAVSALLVARSAWLDRRHGRLPLRRLFPRLLLPLAVLGVFAAAAGAINYERWGNPLTFVDLNRSIAYRTLFPERLLVLAQHGAFDPARIGYGLVYYLFPVWAMRSRDGGFLFEDFQQRFMDSVELPPGSLLVSDPLMVGLAVVGIVLAWRRRRRAVVDLSAFSLVGAGLALPILLMLTAISMTFRYRGEFYPLLEFLACTGFFFACSAPSPPSSSVRALVLAGCVVGVLGTHVSLALYDLSPFGSARDNIPDHEIVDYYKGRLAVFFSSPPAGPLPATQPRH